MSYPKNVKLCQEHSFNFEYRSLDVHRTELEMRVLFGGFTSNKSEEMFHQKRGKKQRWLKMNIYNNERPFVKRIIFALMCLFFYHSDLIDSALFEHWSQYVYVQI